MTAETGMEREEAEWESLADRLALFDELYEALEIAQVRECASWCDRGLGEHTSYCKAQRAALAKARGELTEGTKND